VFELARRLTDRFDVTVLAPHAPGLATTEQMEDIQVRRFRYAPQFFERLAYEGGMLAKLHRSPWYWCLIPLFLAGQCIATLQLLRRQSIDLVHAHWLLPQGLIAVLARALSPRRPGVLCTSHGGDLYAIKGRLGSRLKSWTLRHCDHVTVVSDAMADKVIQLGAAPERLSIAPMGTELELLFSPGSEPRGPDTLLFVGRLVEKKGLEYLLRAMPLVLQRYPGAHLTVVGAGPEAPHLEQLAAELSLASAVSFLGAIEHSALPAIYRKAAIAIFPYVPTRSGDQEGFGLVMVEALGCGCAVIATAMDTTRDVLIDGTTGLAVPPKNPGAIADAVLRLMDEPTQARRLSAQGRRHVQAHFGWLPVARGYRSILFSMAGTEPPASSQP